MKTYEEMQKKLTAQDNERTTQHQTLKDSLENAQRELDRLNGEKEQAMEAGDTAALIQKNTEIQMKEFSVQKMQEQLDGFVYQIISAPEFHQQKKELWEFTNKKLDAKYCRMKELFDAAAGVLQEIEEINQQHGDTY